MVVPLWVGGGTRLKVLEALAAARPVVGTAVGVEGIGFTPGVARAGRREPAGAGGRRWPSCSPIPARAAALGAAGRELAERFRWPRALERLETAYREWIAAADRTIVERRRLKRKVCGRAADQ